MVTLVPIGDTQKKISNLATFYFMLMTKVLFNIYKKKILFIKTLKA